MAVRRRWIVAGVAALVACTVLVTAVGVVWWIRPGGMTEEAVRQTVVTTLQAEAAASFYVTGTLDVTATTTVENTKVLFPDLFGFELGTTRARVRLPGRVAYGFDVRALRAEDIRFLEDGAVEIVLPALSVFSVEPRLEAMEVETDVGWARTRAGSGKAVTERAIAFAQEALRRQGERYLEDATQPRLNTGEALEALLRPVLQAAGMPEPRLRFRVGGYVISTPEG
ncbi:MAG: DUF4230 domain-containing protein [Rhodothermales bacterium]|nr:DUF4230 domain-containing protein [Rhodothermales bacterium]